MNSEALNILKCQLLEGNIKSLSKAITLVESQRWADRISSNNLVKEIWPYTGKSIRIGITGTPGAGKSSLINALAKVFLDNHYKVAVLAIDPSSSYSGGSILGDKTRMEDISSKAFIRPTPHRGQQGGVAPSTFETLLLCEAAGYNCIFVESVGVGQTELDIQHLVDVVIGLSLPESGDDLQGMKKGILEVIDLAVLNKMDVFSHTQIQKALKQLPQTFYAKMAISVFDGEQIQKLYTSVLDFIAEQKLANAFEEKRVNQNNYWIDQLLWRWVEVFYKENEALQSLKQKLFDKKEISPSEGAYNLFKSWVKLQ